MNIEERFRRFASNLELSETETTKVSKVQAEVRAVIESCPHVRKTELIGSYDRKTKIRPLHDVDILVVLGFDQRRIANPKLALSDVMRIVPSIRKKYALIGPRTQKRSINIRTAGMGFDLVPAFELDYGYAIPDKALGSWIRTDPLLYARLLTERNQSDGCSKKLVPFIKMIKCWAFVHEVSFLSSFLTELLVFQSVPSIESYTRCSLDFFSRAQSLVPWPVIDPAMGHDVNELIHSERLDLSKRLCTYSEMATRAVVLEDQGRIAPAAMLWCRIFGKDFPLRMGPGG